MGTGLGVYKLRLRRLLGSAITLQGGGDRKSTPAGDREQRHGRST
jgi:hypothetical protein